MDLKLTCDSRPAHTSALPSPWLNQAIKSWKPEIRGLLSTDCLLYLIGASSQTVREGQKVKRRQWCHSLANTKDCGKHGGGENLTLLASRDHRDTRDLCVSLCVYTLLYILCGLCVCVCVCLLLLISIIVSLCVCEVTCSNVMDSKHSCGLRVFWF